MAKKENFNIGTVPHPGFILKMELKARGISQKNFAQQISIQPSHLSEIIKSKKQISDSIAKKIESALGIPASHFIQMQAEYNYQIKSIDLKKETEYKAEMELMDYNAIYDMRTIFKYIGILEKPASERLEFCKKYLGFGTPSFQANQVKGCFHKSEKTGLDTRMIATWTILAKYEFSHISNPETDFHKDEMDNLATELARIFKTNINTINTTKRTLEKYGIKFCIVPKISHASIDGFSCYSNGVPAIAVTLRYNRIDNFAFAVLHEVGHLKMHFSNKGYSKINLAYPNEELITKEEIEANNFASNALIPKEIWENAPATKLNPHDIQSCYTKWAKENNLNKWIVLGRISHETGIYMFKSDKSRYIN